jgi:hypothetical protein
MTGVQYSFCRGKFTETRGPQTTGATDIYVEYNHSNVMVLKRLLLE